MKYEEILDGVRLFGPGLSTKYPHSQPIQIQSKTHKWLFLVPSCKQVIDLIEICNELMITIKKREWYNDEEMCAMLDERLMGR